MVKTVTIYTLSEYEARRKVAEWYSDKKNLRIFSCKPIQLDDKAMELEISYDDD